MIDLSPELLAIILLGGVALGVMTGYPVPFIIGVASLIVGYFVFGPAVIRAIDLRMWGMMTEYILLAVPLFVFMGVMLERSGIGEVLYDALYKWLGGLKGGLAIVTVAMGTILAACVGVIAASITMLSLTSLSPMLKRGYSKSFALGAITAGGCLGILIPPSIMLVTYAPLAGVSVGRLFFGALIPGLILSALYVTYIVVRSLLQPNIAPPISGEKEESLLVKTWLLVKAIGPVMLIIMSVLGTIFFGIAPPTEAAAMGAFATTILTIAYRRFSLNVLKGAAMVTMQMCGFIFLFLIMAVAFTAVFLGGGGGGVVEDILLAAPGGKWGMFITTMLALFIMGMFLQWMGIVFIMVPIITPIAAAAGFDPVWFAIMVCVNLQMALMTPPFACGLFICRGACPTELGVTMNDIVRGTIPYVALVWVTLVVLTIFPGLITWLPDLMIRFL
jgi:tripartite ATP-independent transporter DctM subunit